MRLVVIGGDAAGMTAATAVVRARDDAEVVVLERGPHTSYSMCGIPYYVGGAFDDADRLVVRTPDEFRRMGMTVHLRTEAIGIDPEGSRVRVRDLEAGGERDEPYDVLLVATGSHPLRSDLPGLDEYGHVVHTLDEGEHLRAHLDAARPGQRSAGTGLSPTAVHRVAVVGAGYIGLEVAEALVERGLETRLIDRNPHAMKTLDPPMAAIVEQRLAEFGVELHLGEDLREVRGESDGCREVVTDQGVYPADTVVLAMGGKPNVAIAAAAGCAVGPSGALVVDERMRTTVGRIWAAGDCVECRDLVAGLRLRVPLGTHANKQGKVAGLDLAAWPGDGGAAFPGVVGTAVTKVCDWEIARVGLTEDDARRAGLDYGVVRFQGTARAGYMPDPGTVHVQMTAERGTGRVLGTQLVGTGNVGKRIDVAAVWCQLGVTVQEAQFFDLSYAPPFGGVWDLLQVGARKLVGELGLSPRL